MFKRILLAAALLSPVAAQAYQFQCYSFTGDRTAPKVIADNGGGKGWLKYQGMPGRDVDFEVIEKTGDMRWKFGTYQYFEISPDGIGRLMKFEKYAYQLQGFNYDCKMVEP